MVVINIDSDLNSLFWFVSSFKFKWTSSYLLVQIIIPHHMGFPWRIQITFGFMKQNLQKKMVLGKERANEQKKRSWRFLIHYVSFVTLWKLFANLLCHFTSQVIAYVLSTSYLYSFSFFLPSPFTCPSPSYAFRSLLLHNQFNTYQLFSVSIQFN